MVGGGAGFPTSGGLADGLAANSGFGSGLGAVECAGGIKGAEGLGAVL